MRRRMMTMAAAVCGTVIGGLIGAGPVRADAPRPFEEFTFKKIAPPKTGSARKRITIQITPEDMARQNPALGRRADPGAAKAGAETGADAGAGASAPDGAAAPVPGQYAWFWESISPALSESGPGRLELALNRIANPPVGQGGVRAPRLQGLQDLAQLRGADILRATIGTEVSPALVLAVIAVESSGRVDAVSGAGAMGLMQLMPDTAQRFGVVDASLPGDNIKGGVAFLDQLMKAFDRDPIMVLAGYNAGEGAVRSHGGVPPYAETRDYVPKVLAAFHTARGLCLTQPMLVSDGCVFNVDVAGGG